MHDIITHSVGLMAVQAEAGPLVVRSDPAKAEAAFEAIAATGREAIGQLRLLLGALRGAGERGHLVCLKVRTRSVVHCSGISQGMKWPP